MKLTLAGWLFLVSAWAAILALSAWCVVRLLRPSGAKGAAEDSENGA